MHIDVRIDTVSLLLQVYSTGTFILTPCLFDVQVLFFLQPFTKDGVSDCLKPSDNATQIHRWSPLLTKHAEALNAPGRPVRRR